MADPNDPLFDGPAPRPGTPEEAEKRRKVLVLGGGCGYLGIPLLLPILLVIAAFLYPIAGFLTLASWYLPNEIFQGMGLSGLPLYALTYGPAAVVMWISVRWDVWLGENGIYWLIRHIVRNLLLIVVLIVGTSAEGLPDAQSDEEMIAFFFHNKGALAISAGALAFFNFILIGRQGFLRQFWHGLLELARLQPAGLDD